MYLLKAIRQINPNAKFILEGNDLNNIQWIEETFPIPVADIEAKISELKIADEQAKAQAEADALAGNNKLLALGLSQAEVTAMTGYTPPVSE